jgi:hypothetical protein
MARAPGGDEAPTSGPWHGKRRLIDGSRAIEISEIKILPKQNWLKEIARSLEKFQENSWRKKV